MALRKAGIVVLGNITEQACPSTALWLTSVTHSLPEILEKVMKNSNNAYAETLLYHLGATQGRPSTAKKSIAVEETLLKKIYSQQSGSLPYPWAGRNGVPPHRFADGSGLSLYNYVSPEMEVAYLHYAYTHDNIFPYLYDALPIAGIDGTLEQRMMNTRAEHNVRAKTGTLTGVISLAGYCKTSGEHALAFSIIINGCLNAERARNLQDKICAILCE
jgi:D-alanyl-D-alanine carboxypeptidase/D-alanyl-D-alanine-endopeptidase (penicillin-binding protein 4)